MSGHAGDFLYARQKIHNGVLQRFVVPKGSCNSMIRAIWTPKMCLLERKTNARRLHDLRYGLYERAVTFDGADAYSNPDPVRGSILPGDIQYLCEQIVDHVMEVSFHKHRISRMVLHLKTDSDDNVWLLWSSSVRLAHAATLCDLIKPLDINADAHVPSFVHLNVMPDGKPKSKIKQFTTCRSCGASIDASVGSTVTYKAILEHFRQLLHALKVDMLRRPTAAVLWPPDDSIIHAAGGVGFGILRDTAPHLPSSSSSQHGAPRRPNVSKPITETDVTIPPMLRSLHPHLTLDDFGRFSHDPVFLYKTATVCTDCFLVFADYSTSALEVNTLRQEAPAVLRPQRDIPPLKQGGLVKSTSTLPNSAWMPQKGGKSPSSIVAAMPKRQYTFKPPPSLPQRIDHTMLDEVERQMPSELLRSSASAPTIRSSPPPPNQTTNPHHPVTAAAYVPEAWRQQPTMVPNPLLSANALTTMAKEDSFFADLSASSMTLAQHHPLRHMVDSASKLTTSTAAASISSLSEATGPPRKAKTVRNPYTVVQTLRGDGTGGVAASSAQIDRKKPHKKSTVARLSRKSSAASMTFQRLVPTDEERVTSLKHREFLLQSLHEIQQQMATPDTLADVLGDAWTSDRRQQSARTPVFDEEATTYSTNSNDDEYACSTEDLQEKNHRSNAIKDDQNDDERRAYGGSARREIEADLATPAMLLRQPPLQDDHSGGVLQSELDPAAMVLTGRSATSRPQDVDDGTDTRHLTPPMGGSSPPTPSTEEPSLTSGLGDDLILPLSTESSTSQTFHDEVNGTSDSTPVDMSSTEPDGALELAISTQQLPFTGDSDALPDGLVSERHSVASDDMAMSASSTPAAAADSSGHDDMDEGGATYL
ncbi:hypothetical protein, variant 2 [Aphanomyces astaci]|uniref:Uncharacterized protein n=1 Tax=Aphanomyces astaci TaxID=112090 RepID=W4GPU6_APHAT|nr:hypothetical protein, variant 2 [Aphanomyces astaci]ETV81351.1 hypothetical protein, variant 2 [Aphanomyces astaci]|eukprot:XP_009829209.1 hypothetical protein, variant 2 [Aphanomyces astaci]